MTVSVMPAMTGRIKPAMTVSVMSAMTGRIKNCNSANVLFYICINVLQKRKNEKNTLELNLRCFLSLKKNHKVIFYSVTCSSKTKSVLGGITFPAPFSPYAK